MSRHNPREPVGWRRAFDHGVERPRRKVGSTGSSAMAPTRSGCSDSHALSGWVAESDSAAVEALRLRLWRAAVEADDDAAVISDAAVIRLMTMRPSPTMRPSSASTGRSCGPPHRPHHRPVGDAEDGEWAVRNGREKEEEEEEEEVVVVVEVEPASTSASVTPVPERQVELRAEAESGDESGNQPPPVAGAGEGASSSSAAAASGDSPWGPSWLVGESARREYAAAACRSSMASDGEGGGMQPGLQEGGGLQPALSPALQPEGGGLQPPGSPVEEYLRSLKAHHACLTAAITTPSPERLAAALQTKQRSLVHAAACQEAVVPVWTQTRPARIRAAVVRRARQLTRERQLLAAQDAPPPPDRGGSRGTSPSSAVLRAIAKTSHWTPLTPKERALVAYAVAAARFDPPTAAACSGGDAYRRNSGGGSSCGGLRGGGSGGSGGGGGGGGGS
eukprot:scaffold40080_cov56-Phaeocystis_antarctica.AAC.7